MKMGELCPSEVLLSTYQTTRRHNPEDYNINNVAQYSKSLLFQILKRQAIQLQA